MPLSICLQLSLNNSPCSRAPRIIKESRNKIDNYRITSIFQEAYGLPLSSMDLHFPPQLHCNDTVEAAFIFSGHCLSLTLYFCSQSPWPPLETQSSKCFFFLYSSPRNASPLTTQPTGLLRSVCFRIQHLRDRWDSFKIEGILYHKEYVLLD